MTNTPLQLQLALGSHNNHSLFSDHYLNEILFRSLTWTHALEHGRSLLTFLRQHYQQEQNQLSGYNETQLEDNWIIPILARLGHTWERQATIPGLTGNIKKPDYAFFPDDNTRRQAVTLQNSADYARSALAIGEVKQWELNLSKKTGDQPRFDDQNPMYQIDTYLNLTGLQWGILSNGRHWRLVHKNTSRTLDTYFEIDLLTALLNPNDAAAQAIATYFYLFFHQSAFHPDPHDRIFLQDALNESQAYAVALEADLRDNAYRSLEQLIIGFFAGDPTLDQQNLDHRRQVYQNSLYLLYRLLFLLYGESRSLLPMHNPEYKNHYSLQRLAQSINTDRNTLDTLPATGRRHWNYLRELFRLISGTDSQFNADLGVPRYNGGLFDAQQHSFLENHFVGDRHLARAIDYLTYRRTEKNGKFAGYEAADYRTLDVRQLGSIYEGLLEYKVAIATEEMVTIRKGSTETWIPASQRGRAKALTHRRQPGELYLATDKGERKATGSYYTPDYIVEYIVAQTLDPLVEQARQTVKDQVRQTGSLDPVERNRQSAHHFIAEILSLNVLDPAMGSGHFLVEAMNYLARALATDNYVQAVPSEAEGWGGTESDLLYWQRRVVEACIYGVDKNPMAVELAKLSLWLKTAAADKPLSFLDHHLRHGDSLIGAWLTDLEAAPGAKQLQPDPNQQPLFDAATFAQDISYAVQGITAIENQPTSDIDDVHTKETAWHNIQQTRLNHWRRLADLWVSYYFADQPYTPKEYRSLAYHLQGKDTIMTEAQAAQFLNAHTANRQINPDLDYLHWQLAFPEVFFDEDGRSLNQAAGFDAIIGNPPYVRIQRLSELATNYFLNKYESCSKKTDLSVAFLERGFDLLASHGVASFISSSQWLSTDYGQATREYMSDGKIEKIVDFGSLPVFENVSTYPAIFIFQKQKTSKLQYAKVETLPDTSYELSKLSFIEHSYEDISKDSWVLNNLNLRIVLAKNEDALQLSELGHFYIGALTGMDDVFIVTDELVSANNLETDLLLPYAYRGEEVIRYGLVKPRKKIIYPYSIGEGGNSVLIPEEELRTIYPNIYNYLLHYKQALTQRLDSRRKYADGPNWYCFLRPGRFNYITPEKLIIQGVATRTFVGFLESHTAFNGANTPGFIYDTERSERLHFLLAILNSKLISDYLMQVCPPKLHGYVRFNANNLNEIPIVSIKFKTGDIQRTAVLSTAQTHYQQNNQPALLALTAAELAAHRNDTIHDLLAYLAQQMITLNQQKQTALEAFWLDLEGVTPDAKTFDTLHNKGKWEQSLHKAIPAVRPYLNPDSRSTITLDASLGWNEDSFKGFIKELVGPITGLGQLVQVYRHHAPTITTLNQELTTTDHLIDQIVYNLYGLTSAEITIIEEATN